MVLFLVVVRWYQFEVTLFLRLYLKEKILFMKFFLHNEHLY